MRPGPRKLVVVVMSSIVLSATGTPFAVPGAAARKRIPPAGSQEGEGQYFLVPPVSSGGAPSRKPAAPNQPQRPHHRAHRSRHHRHRKHVKHDAQPAPPTPAPVEGYRIPVFLLPIYQLAGARYGVPWEVLAAINEIESDYGRNVSVSSAGAVGWMQFLPSTWRVYGVDANRDRRRDPYNPADAIFAAARYLKAAGAEQNLPGAIFAYNHADWYVRSVLERAGLIASLPEAVVESLTGLAQARFPIPVRATYAPPGHGPDPQGADLEARRGAAVVAVEDGRIVRVGTNPRLGHFVMLEDLHGNRYTYGRLAAVARHPAPLGSGRPRLYEAPDDLPRRPERPFAHPRPPEQGTRVTAGTILGRIGHMEDGQAPRLRFEIRPAGRGLPRIDPRPILDGWRLLEATGISSAPEPDPLLVAEGAGSFLTTGQTVLPGPAEVARRVLADPHVQIYPCGRRDIEAGVVDGRVLAVLEYLAAGGLDPTVSSLECGHPYLTKSGNVSEHSTGDAVDIAAINGVPILNHQGPGSLTDLTIRRLLLLQGTMKPHQIISLMTYAGADNTLALADHDDHIHVGFHPRLGGGTPGLSDLGPERWRRLAEQLGRIANPPMSHLSCRRCQKRDSALTLRQKARLRVRARRQ